jgi:hypothetical protein
MTVDRWDATFIVGLRDTRPRPVRTSSEHQCVDYSRIDPDSVAWAYENASALLQQERDRVSSLNDKAAQLAGFSGVILAILGSFAREGFTAKLGSVGEVVFAVCYFGAALALALAVAILILLVYRPRRFIAVDAAELGNYLGDERLLQSKPWGLQIRTMRTLHLAAKWAEKGAAEMASRIRIAVSVFGAGLALFVGAVITLGLGQL